MTTTYWNSATSDAASVCGAAPRLRQMTFVGLVLTAAAVNFSIAIAQIWLALTAVTWAAMLVTERRLPAAPPWAAALLGLGAWTLVSAAFSLDPRTSFVDAK